MLFYGLNIYFWYSFIYESWRKNKYNQNYELFYYQLYNKKGIVYIIYAFYFKQSYTDISSISVKNKYNSNENKGEILFFVLNKTTGIQLHNW